MSKHMKSDGADVCGQIISLYPDLGECGDEVSVSWDSENEAWAVDFVVKGRQIRHYLEDDDAVACIFGKECIGMGIEFAQFH